MVKSRRNVVDSARWSVEWKQTKRQVGTQKTVIRNAAIWQACRAKFLSWLAVVVGVAVNGIVHPSRRKSEALLQEIGCSSLTMSLVNWYSTSWIITCSTNKYFLFVSLLSGAPRMKSSFWSRRTGKWLFAIQCSSYSSERHSYQGSWGKVHSSDAHRRLKGFKVAIAAVI